MSASEKLKALESWYAGDVAVLRNALPQIVAVVEALEQVERQDPGSFSHTYGVFRQIARPALAALEKELS